MERAGGEPGNGEIKTGLEFRVHGFGVKDKVQGILSDPMLRTPTYRGRRAMNKKTFILLLMFGFCFSAATGQEREKRPGPGIAEWLKALQLKISQLAPNKTAPVSTGVAGVRGAKEDAQAKLYWKGKKSEETVSEEELAQFRNAIDYAAKDDKTNAIRGLEEFMRRFPDSTLIPDAKKTLDLVKAEQKAEEKPDEK